MTQDPQDPPEEPERADSGGAASSGVVPLELTPEVLEHEPHSDDPVPSGMTEHTENWHLSARARGRVSEFHALAPEEQQRQIDEARAKGLCGARPPHYSDRDWPCRKTGSGSGGRCSRHGGATPLPTSGGIYSKRMTKMRERFEEAQSNPHLWDLTPVVALHDVRIGQLIEQAEANDSPEFRQRVLAHVEMLEVALGSGSEHEIVSAFGELKRYAKRGRAESAAWRELLKTARDRSHKVEEAAKIALRGTEAVSRRDLEAALGSIIDIVLDEAPETSWAERIITRIDRELMGGSLTAEAPSAASAKSAVPRVSG